jgi:catechol 2,3-dioxygenase-like lactoylglutathione lyase family enzyme
MDNIHHLAIQVKNIKDSVSWYNKQFNCKIVYEDDSWAMIEFANISLALVLAEQHPFHFAILDNEAEKYGELKHHRDGTASIYIKDPSGNNIEILKVK